MTELSLLFSSAGCISCALYFGGRHFIGRESCKSLSARQRLENAFGKAHWVLAALVILSMILIIAEIG